MSRKDRRRLKSARQSAGKGKGADPQAALAAALEHHRGGRLDKAKRLYERVLRQQPDNADALHLLGLTAHQAGRHERAIELIGKATRISPENGHFFNNLGEAYRSAGRRDEAIRCYQQALKLDASDAMALNNLGNALAEQGKMDEAAASYLRALDIDPGYAEAHSNLGDALAGQEKMDEAAVCYRRAIEINPHLAQVHDSLATALTALGQTQEAAASYHRALDIDPGYVPALNNLGNLLSSMGKWDEAEDCYRRSLEMAPDLAQVHVHLGNLLADRKKPREAIDSYRRALKIKADFSEAVAQLLHQSQMAFMWRDLEELSPRLDQLTAAEIAGGESVGETPFINVSRCLDPHWNLGVARSWSREISLRVSKPAADVPRRDRDGKKAPITIGYLSRDFYNHATAHLMLSLFTLHDREKFRVRAYSYGPRDGSFYRQRIEQDCDGFADIRDLNDVEAAKRIGADKVDILVDLKGHTQGNRLGICALRPAPVQAAYLGFPGTTGADFIDYVITDRIVTPEEHLPFYSEQPAYLPHTYQVNDHRQAISERGFRRADFALPEYAVVFCSFNQAYKIEPVMFSVWADILNAIPGSVLWLLASTAFAEGNLRDEAKARGVAPERLIFAGKLPKDEHLERTRLADLVLDTRICNGHTTTSDALWAGVPVITLLGAHFASRVSASLLYALGLPELVTHSIEDYRDLALRLAQNPGDLRALKEKLAKNRRAQPLFDTPRFAKNLEHAYQGMWETHLADKRPKPIQVSDRPITGKP